MLANLRGVKESGQIFMIPTYAFIASIFLLLEIGLFTHHAIIYSVSRIKLCVFVFC
jgi:amino acid transporter